eukprot:CAMPEP_0179107718 /NCGR_PEP_ID=MMETSP0796-20121207/50145_1 /TAXON_ID=73915 /ORGANISM="Pyrodinium bahamense, Strain pbaha01" /LENGTH=81 /DNA_ID=CAMNT_0020805779 /DNA_START=11 /DNA_END=253 /DNA_ORIENTATION=-
MRPASDRQAVTRSAPLHKLITAPLSLPPSAPSRSSRAGRQGSHLRAESQALGCRVGGSTEVPLLLALAQAAAALVQEVVDH